MYMSVTISQFISPSLNPGNHKFVFYICNTASVLWISSIVPFLKKSHSKKYNNLPFLSDFIHYDNPLGLFMSLHWALFCSFLWLIFHCIHVPHLCPFLCQTGCFHVLAIVNNAAVNIGAHVSFWILWFALDICPGLGFLDHKAVLFLIS